MQSQMKKNYLKASVMRHDSGADISGCGFYRYMLWRTMPSEGPWLRTSVNVCTFIMLNPSTATDTEDDATIRRCMGYAGRWGYRKLVVVNLFAFRTTSPEILKRLSPVQADPVGVSNASAIKVAARMSDLIVCAWGAHGDLVGWGDKSGDGELFYRGSYVRDRLTEDGYKLYCLGLTKNGQPLHPLRLRADLQPQEWRWDS